MKVFISWSGAKSKAAAEAMRDWLPSIIQAVEPWMSSEDIDKGTRWFSDIAQQLEQATIGLICLTLDNMYSPWILFEAGALSKTLDKSFVCPWLLDFDEKSLRGPLVQFQVTKADKDDTKKLIHTVNSALGSQSIDKERLDDIFDMFWPRLEQRLQNLPSSPSISNSAPESRDTADTLVEILELVRDLKRQTSFADDTEKLKALLENEATKLEGERKLIELKLMYEQEMRELYQKHDLERQRQDLNFRKEVAELEQLTRELQKDDTTQNE